MKGKITGKSWLIVPGSLFVFAVAGLTWALIQPSGAALSTGQIYSKLIVPLSKMLVFLGLGLLAGQALESLGWTTKLAGAVRPMTRSGTSQ